MKKALLIIVCCIFCSMSYAQIQTGSKYIGGTLGGSYDQPHPPAGKSSSLTLKPTAGTFLNDNWMVGISGEYGRQWNESNSRSSQRVEDYTYYLWLKSNTRQTFSIGPVARYYQQLTPQLVVFGEGSMGYALTINKNDYVYYATDSFGQEVFNSSNKANVKTRQLYAGFAPGVAFFVTPKLGIELKTNVLRYTHGIGNGPNQDPVLFNYYANSQRNFTANFTLAATSIGAGYYF